MGIEVESWNYKWSLECLILELRTKLEVGFEVSSGGWCCRSELEDRGLVGGTSCRLVLDD